MPVVARHTDNIQNKSVGRFLTILMLAAIVIPAILSGGIFIAYHYFSSIKQEQVHRAENFVELLEAGMRLPLWGLDKDLAHPLIEAVSIDPSVNQITVWDIQEVFVKYRKPNQVASPSDLVLQRKIRFADTDIGKVEIIYSLDKAKQVVWRDSQIVMFIVLIQLVISLFLLHHFLRKRVTAPLAELEKSAINIAQGNFNFKVIPGNDDELGRLASQLESMRQALEEIVNSLSQQADQNNIKYNRANNELLKVVDRLETTQESLIQYEKLAALGSLVAGISHELNTPIGNALMVVSSLQSATHQMILEMKSTISKQLLEQYISRIKEGTQLAQVSLQRASNLIGSFKQVAVDRTNEKRREFYLFQVVNETLLTLQPSFSKTEIIIEQDIDPTLYLSSYPGPIGQILTNLLENARWHAFPAPSQESLATSTKPTIKISAQQIGEDLKLSVSDNGCGIAAELHDKIFEPFYSTSLSQGTGLGLHIVHNIVTGVLHGKIQVLSELTKGSTFILKFPMHAPATQQWLGGKQFKLEINNESL